MRKIKHKKSKTDNHLLDFNLFKEWRIKEIFKLIDTISVLSIHKKNFGIVLNTILIIFNFCNVCIFEEISVSIHYITTFFNLLIIPFKIIIIIKCLLVKTALRHRRC